MAWNKALPAGATVAALADDAIRANNDQLETALDTEHIFTTAGAQLAKHRPGGCAVCYVGTTAEIAAILLGGTLINGGLAYDTDKGQLYTVVGGVLTAMVEIDTTAALTADSDLKVPSQKAVKAAIESGTFTMAGKTLTSPVINTQVTGDCIKTSLAENSDLNLPTQKAVKTYADAKAVVVPAGTLIHNGDSPGSGAWADLDTGLAASAIVLLKVQNVNGAAQAYAFKDADEALDTDLDVSYGLGVSSGRANNALEILYLIVMTNSAGFVKWKTYYTSAGGTYQTKIWVLGYIK